MAAGAKRYHVPEPLMPTSLIVQVMRLVDLSVQVFMTDNALPTVKIESCFAYLLPIRVTPDILVVINQLPVGQICNAQ